MEKFREQNCQLQQGNVAVEQKKRNNIFALL